MWSLGVKKGVVSLAGVGVVVHFLQDIDHPKALVLGTMRGEEPYRLL